jgi:hypothetical protein
MTTGQAHTMDEAASTATTTWERHSLTWLAQPGWALDGPGHGGPECLPIPLWEWSVTRDAAGAPSGICHTYRRAIQALTRALTQTGRPRRGQVVPVLLTEPTHNPVGYLRGHPHRTAVFDGKAIQWT